MERFNLAQRVIAVVALGAVLLLAGTYLTTAATFTGWSGDAPLTVGHFAARDGLAPLANFFVWFGLVVAWCAASLLLLRGSFRRRRVAKAHSVDVPAPPTGD